MAKLEAKARQLAAESAQDQAQTDKGIMFVREEDQPSSHTEYFDHVVVILVSESQFLV